MASPPVLFLKNIRLTFGATPLLTGADITEAHWDAFFAFYMDTGDRKWGRPYLTRDFFARMQRDMPQHWVMFVAERNGRRIAASLVALDPDDGSMLGAVRLLADANYESGEYGILVRSDLKGHGIGWKLMQIMIEYARWLGLKVIEGQVLRENRTMLAMCESLGFTVKLDPDDPTLMNVSLPVSAGA